MACPQGSWPNSPSATGPGQDPTISELVALNRDERLAAEGREASRTAVRELRGLGYLTPDATTAPVSGSV